uniref:Caspase-8 n=1 Tax=Monopterus albus TaxID=43700 RepID=A0A3Q3JK88_MONAL|nr:caspase-8-like isoform X1 [Monopterus albus]
MEFQRLLLKVEKALCKDEVKALAFLCTDLLGRNPTSVESASALFSRLVDQDHLSPERPHLLTELLLTIQRNRLVRELGLSECTTMSLISEYRKLLYNLSEEITDEDLKKVKFLLNPTLPRRRLEDNTTTLEVFLEMEHMDHLSETNLNELEAIIQSVCPVLKEKIAQFKALPVQNSPVGQETGSVYQSPQSLDDERTASCKIPAPRLAECSMFSTNTSVDVVHGGDESEALSHGLNSLSTETSTHASSQVRSDTLEKSSQESMISETQMFQTTGTTSEGLGAYPMTSAKRGVCLIINNYDFTKSRNVSLRIREGTATDKDCLHKVFTWLGFETEIYNDYESKEMLSLLQGLSRRDHSRMDCMACCILSHGKNGSVYGVDGRTVELSELKELFNGINCHSLAEKPKLFFIQACQGTKEQQPVYIESDAPAESHICSDAVAIESIPSDADFLQAVSTVPHCVSYRERRNGSWFIQSLCQNLIQMVPWGCDLVSILTKVNADVSQKSDATGKKKQIPQPSFSLRKKVVFPVPKAAPPSMPSF